MSWKHIENITQRQVDGFFNTNTDDYLGVEAIITDDECTADGLVSLSRSEANEWFLAKKACEPWQTVCPSVDCRIDSPGGVVMSIVDTTTKKKYQKSLQDCAEKLISHNL